MRQGCRAINVADERKIKAATSPTTLAGFWDSRPRRADGSDNEDRENLRCVLSVDTRLFFLIFFLRESFANVDRRENEGAKKKTSNNAGRFADRAEALAGEICGLFMKTRRGGSRRRGKQSALRQSEAAGEFVECGSTNRLRPCARALYGHRIDAFERSHVISGSYGRQNTAGFQVGHTSTSERSGIMFKQ